MSPSHARRLKWGVALTSVVIAIVAAEALLRLSLFGTSIDFASKDPAYYARTLDELWIYRYLFSSSKRWTVAEGEHDSSRETGIEFYRNWAASLTPDGELGYVRRANVRTPCHETTNFGTRGIHDYAANGPKILFFGDSFVESAACSNDTLPAKIEKLTGIDTLNYGIGGYGVDQIYLYLRRSLPVLDKRDSLFLVGVIQDDFNRVLLAVRTSPKPYFTIENGTLVLHAEHIHPASLSDFYRRPPERFYLYYFLRGRLGYPIYRSLLHETERVRNQAIHDTSRLLFKAFADLGRQENVALAFVLFATPGVNFDNAILSLMREQKIPVIDLRGCLSNVPDQDVYAELHPTSLGNEMLARCLVSDLVAQKLLTR